MIRERPVFGQGASATGFVAALTAAAFVGGCAVGPDYQTPQTAVPDRFDAAAASPPPTRPAKLDRWWTLLGDPMLDSLIDRARVSNLDVQIAEARVREARALRSVVSADWWPQIGTGAAYAYKGTSENAQPKPKTAEGGGALTRLPSVTIKPGDPLSGGGYGPPTITLTPASGGDASAARSGAGYFSRDLNLFQAGFDASWELDVFGGIRRSVEAAEADTAAAEEASRAVLVTVFSEVARNYVELRGYQRRLAIARENIAAQEATVELTRSLARGGVTSDLDVAQAETQLASSRSVVPTLETLRDRAIYRVAVLLGRAPGELAAEFEAEAPIPTAPPEVPLGLPSDLLRRRPDIRQSERELAAATARIGVATADLFPRFSLTGAFGTQTRDMQHFLDRKSFFWSVGPSVSWPIFDGGRIRANIEVQSARERQAFLQYESRILAALEEVDNALTAYRNERVRYGHLSDAVEAGRRALDLANERYVRKIAPFLNVLEAQRSLFLTEDQLVQSEAATTVNLIALCKALGGGWAEEAPPPVAAIPLASGGS